MKRVVIACVVVFFILVGSVLAIVFENNHHFFVLSGVPLFPAWIQSVISCRFMGIVMANCPLANAVHVSIIFCFLYAIVPFCLYKTRKGFSKSFWNTLIFIYSGIVFFTYLSFCIYLFFALSPLPTIMRIYGNSWVTYENKEDGYRLLYPRHVEWSVSGGQVEKPKECNAISWQGMTERGNVVYYQAIPCPEEGRERSSITIGGRVDENWDDSVNAQYIGVFVWANPAHVPLRQWIVENACGFYIRSGYWQKTLIENLDLEDEKSSVWCRDTDDVAKAQVTAGVEEILKRYKDTVFKGNKGISFTDSRGNTIVFFSRKGKIYAVRSYHKSKYNTGIMGKIKDDIYNRMVDSLVFQ